MEIIKSPNDPKLYRFLTLQNGLRALLISDVSQTVNCHHHHHDDDHDDDAADDDDGDCDGDDDDDQWSDINDDDDDCDDDDCDDDDCDDDDDDADDDDADDGGDAKARKARPLQSEKLAAAALCVGVGSFSDPDDIPGLAHFLEHMVFMGSAAYPQENSLDDFLRRHGGSDNASTDCEATTFTMDVQASATRPALHRWAQFFISPLMKREAMQREVQAVDSEFREAMKSDAHRVESLLGNIARPQHPMGRFFWGNVESLALSPQSLGVDVHPRLREFYRRHYTASNMTLALQARESLDQMQEWVTDIFSKIPNNGVPKPDFTSAGPPYDLQTFHKLIRVVPVKKLHILRISWSLPSQEQCYRVKPLTYLSWLLGHEGPGSIMAALRDRLWATSLDCGNSESGFEQNATHSNFSVSVTLSDQGLDNTYQVVHLVFQYIKMLQTLGPQERRVGGIRPLPLLAPQPAPVQFCVSRLPLSWPLCCRVRSLHRGDPNSDLTLYYQFGPCTIKENVLMELLVMHMEEPCFDFLRTKHTLGYHVYPMCRVTSNILGLSINVSYQSNKHSVGHVERKVDEFLTQYEASLSLMTSSEFNTQVSALLSRKRCEDAHLGEEVERNWDEVVSRQHLFSRLHREVEVLTSLRREELLEFFSRVTSQARVLTVQVIGSSEVSTATPEVEVTALEFVTPAPADVTVDSMKRKVTNITDIEVFRSTLPRYDHHKIVE